MEFSLFVIAGAFATVMIIVALRIDHAEAMAKARKHYSQNEYSEYLKEKYLGPDFKEKAVRRMEENIRRLREARDGSNRKVD